MAIDPADYLDKAIERFDRDPPDTDFQRGYLEALKVVRAEAFAATGDEFARIYYTEHGQLLAYLDNSDDENGYGIAIIGAPVRCVTPKVVLGYDDEESQRRNFDQITKDVEQIAASLHATAESVAPQVAA